VGANGAPVPGENNPAGQVAQTEGTGGLKAGRGTAPYGNKTTTAMEAKQTGVVSAAPRADGPSESRNVEAGERRENAQREASRMAIDFVKQEEQSLADEPLPAARREQVLRYFTALRNRLLDKPTATPAAPGGK
jgi:hypothetical protein